MNSIFSPNTARHNISNINRSLPFAEEECYHCMASLVASKEKMFITQTKLLNEVTWKTVMQIAKKYAVSINYIFLYLLVG